MGQDVFQTKTVAFGEWPGAGVWLGAAVVIGAGSWLDSAALGNATVSLSGAPLSSPLTVTDTGGTGTVTLNNVPPFIAGGGYSLQITRADHRTRTGRTRMM